MPKISGVEFEEAWRRRVNVRIDDLSVPIISREDLLVAKLAAGRAQDLIDVDALRESNPTQEIEQQQRPASPAASARDELEQISKEGREEWLKLRNQHTPENSRDPQDRSAERDQEAKPKDLSESPDKGLDDDLN